MQELLKRDWPAARDLLNGAPVEMHTGRYSADLFAGPRLPRQATIPNSANSSRPALVNAHGSGDGVPFCHLSIT